MAQQRSIPRRRLLQYAGITASLPLIAGCTDQGSETGDESGDDGGSGEEMNDSVNDTGADNTETNASEESGNENESEGETGEEGEDGEGENSEWQDVDEIVLDGYTEAWEGVEPEPIAGEQNPTITLIAGQEYDFTWENADGQPHNIAFWDSNDEPVVEASETIDTEGETQTVTIEASEEMATYVCELHPTTMIADIQIESGQ